MKFFDSHAHYNDERYENDMEEVINRAYENDIKKIIVSGYNLDTSIKAIEIANKYEFIYATCGISPNDLTNFNEGIKEIKQISKNSKVVAIGEIGLDYYWNKENKEEQKEKFEKQIDLANELNLPILIHTRDAYIDTIDILKKKEVIKKGIFHCCPLNLELIKHGLDLGFYISFSGIVTFKNSKNAEEAIKLVPNDRILIETDSPYLSPEPYRGTRNESINVKLVAEKIANVKNQELSTVAQTTYENAERIFNI